MLALCQKEGFELQHLERGRGQHPDSIAVHFGVEIPGHLAVRNGGVKVSHLAPEKGQLSLDGGQLDVARLGLLTHELGAVHPLHRHLRPAPDVNSQLGILHGLVLPLALQSVQIFHACVHTRLLRVRLPIRQGVQNVPSLHQVILCFRELSGCIQDLVPPLRVRARVRARQLPRRLLQGGVRPGGCTVGVVVCQLVRGADHSTRPQSALQVLKPKLPGVLHVPRVQATQQRAHVPGIQRGYQQAREVFDLAEGEHACVVLVQGLESCKRLGRMVGKGFAHDTPPVGICRVSAGCLGSTARLRRALQLRDGQSVVAVHVQHRLEERSLRVRCIWDKDLK
mmetsp:Transcript_27900/g.52814  ORF Transcript_27900/g.52814 Transcript_27900/m.52814 type:complete len:338 (-) Transcript_27900:664-1677(-)